MIRNNSDEAAVMQEGNGPRRLPAGAVRISGAGIKI
jgi:hypothetical protein